jgi:hypothetical protein
MAVVRSSGLSRDFAIEALRLLEHDIERRAQALHPSELRGPVIGVWGCLRHIVTVVKPMNEDCPILNTASV